MKKILYITLFTILGILVQFLAHSGIEIVYISLLVTKFEVFGLGLTFATWFTIHNIFTVVMFVLGAGAGLWQGTYWWKRLYGSQINIQ